MRYGLIGTGYWAQEIHGAGLMAAPGEDLVGVWGRDASKRQAVASRFGVRAYDSPDDLFADVDAVAFAVPPHVQAPLAVRAAGAGCHLLLEKPTALDASAASEVASACATGGVASVVFFTLRFDPASAAWLSEVRRRDDWQGMDAVWLGNLFTEDSPFGGSPWRRSEGALWDLGPHALSMVLPLMGPVRSVVGMPGHADLVRLLLSHDGDAITQVLLSHTVDDAATRRGIELFGPGGWSAMPEGGGPEVAYRAAVDALAVAAGGGEAHECDAGFGAEVVDVLGQAEAAVRAG